jgi:hypothetical protein
MGLKGYRLWVMGQLDSTCTAPPVVLFVRAPHDPPGGCGGGGALGRLGVALQVAFERQTLKPGFSLDRF